MNTQTEVYLKWSKLSNLGFSPLRVSEGSAGLDLFASKPCLIKARDKNIVNTDIQIAMPHGTYGRIAPRSGLAINYHIDVAGGVIDEDYRGEIKVIIFNHSCVDFEIKRGQRIAQLVCERIYYPKLIECNLSTTLHNINGFGSSKI